MGKAYLHEKPLPHGRGSVSPLVFQAFAPVNGYDSGDNARLMAAAGNDPKTIDTYFVELVHEYDADTDIYLYIDADGSTAGGGRAVMEYVK